MSVLRAMPRRLCIIEMRPDEASEELLAWNAVLPLRDSGLFDCLVLCVGPGRAELGLNRFADTWGIDFFQSQADDTVSTLEACSKASGADIVARVRVTAFIVSPDIVVGQLLALEAEPDIEYVRLPTDVNARFGADVFRPRLLTKLHGIFGDTGLGRRFGARPWGCIEAYPGDFELRTHDELAPLDAACLEHARAGYAAFARQLPQRTSLFPYTQAIELLPAHGAALDIACRDGMGTAILATGGEVLGVDDHEGSVSACQKRWGANANFAFAEDMDLALPARHFDVVTSIRTLDRIADDAGFLRRVSECLKPGGAFLLEVPVRQRSLFESEVSSPLDPQRHREYDGEKLLAQLGEHFETHEVFGENRGAYVDARDARGGLLIIATLRAAG